MLKKDSEYQFGKLLTDSSGDEGIGEGRLTKNDLNVFQEVVKTQFINVLTNYDKTHINSDLSIDKYHETKIAKSKIHDEIWTLSNRHISKELVSKLMSTRFFIALSEQLDWFEILDGTNIGHPDISFRICRPIPFLDGAPLHRDSWFFHPKNSLSMPTKHFKIKRVKVWISLHNDKNTGLRYVKGSHTQKYDYSYEKRNGFFKGNFDESRYKLKIDKLIGECGTFVVFNDELLHGGFSTKKNTRISAEFTLAVRSKG